jgi:hypothetical protein
MGHDAMKSGGKKEAVIGVTPGLHISDCRFQSADFSTANGSVGSEI